MVIDSSPVLFVLLLVAIQLVVVIHHPSQVAKIAFWLLYYAESLTNGLLLLLTALKDL